MLLLLFLGWWWVSVCLQIIYNICEEDRNFSRSRYRALNTRIRLWVGAESVPFKLYRGIIVSSASSTASLSGMSVGVVESLQVCRELSCFFWAKRRLMMIRSEGRFQAFIDTETEWLWRDETKRNDATRVLPPLSRRKLQWSGDTEQTIADFR